MAVKAILFKNSPGVGEIRPLDCLSKSYAYLQRRNQSIALLFSWKAVKAQTTSRFLVQATSNLGSVAKSWRHIVIES